MIRRILTFYIICCFIVTPVWAANTIYVRLDGTAANEAASTSCAAAGTSATLANANSWVDVGDTVEVCDNGGATYTTAINPSASPTAEGERITYQVATGDTVYIDRKLDFTNGKDYITVDGFVFDNLGFDIAEGTNADYIILKNNTFTIDKTAASVWFAVNIGNGCNYWEVDSNTFSAVGADQDSTKDNGGSLLGAGNGVDTTSSHHYIHDNTFIDGSDHDFLALSGADYCVVKDNVFYNTGIYDCTSAEGGFCYVGPDEMLYVEKKADFNTIDGNIFYETSDNIDDQHLVVFHNHNSKYNIYRRNIAYKVDGWFVNLMTNNTDSANSEYNWFYNNSGYDLGGDPRSSNYLGALRLASTSTSPVVKNNVMANNIIHTAGEYLYYHGETNAGTINNDNLFFGNWEYAISQANEIRWIDQDDARDGSFTLITAEGSYGSEFYENYSPNPSPTDATDPKFTALTSPPTKAKFALQSDSSCIDTGQWLTTVNGGTTSTTITVDDFPYMFSQGITGLVAGDTIKTQNGQTAVISSINHGSKQITFTTAITVVDGEGLFLSYNGTAPDIGAQEYGGTPPVPVENFAPANGAEGQATTVDLTYDLQAGETVDVKASETDCATALAGALACDDENTGTCDPAGDWTNSATVYWNVHANTANQDFPSGSTCFEFTVVGTPPDLGGAVYSVSAGSSVYNSGGVTWGYLPP